MQRGCHFPVLNKKQTALDHLLERSLLEENASRIIEHRHKHNLNADLDGHENDPPRQAAAFPSGPTDARWWL